MSAPTSPKLRYDPVAVALHWFIAVSILFMLVLGFWMKELPISIRFDAFAFHKSLGLTILALSIFRLIWRLLNPPPALPATMKPIEKLAANAAHWFLYFLMLALPLTGWVIVSASKKYPTIFFWLTEVPFLPLPAGIDGKATHDQFETYHYYLAWGAIILIIMHAGAALKHHFITRDTVLTRMLPVWLTRRPRA